MNSLFKLLIPPLVFLISFAGCGKKEQGQPQPGKDKVVTLTYWRVKTTPDTFREELSGLAIPGLKIQYATIEEKEYEQKLLRALAEGRGPDVFSIRNDQVEEYKGKIAPAPSNLVNVRVLKANLPQQFSLELILDDKLYGLPFEMESLRLIANDTLFPDELKGIEMPLSWSGVAKIGRKLTVIKDGKMEISGLALGTGEEIDRSAETLQLMMLQDETQMVTPDKRQAGFHLYTERDGKIYYPGVNALKYYTDFANPTSNHYTYDPALGNDIKAFTQGKIAMIINYPSIISDLTPVMPPNTSIKIYPLPNFWHIEYPSREEEGKISDPKDMSRYRIEVVNINSKNKEYAWRVLLEVFNQQGGFSSFFKSSVYEEKFSLRNPLHFSTTFYKGAFPKETDKVFREMADLVVKNKLSPEEAILKGADNFNLLLQKTLKLKEERQR